MIWNQENNQACIKLALALNGFYFSNKASGVLLKGRMFSQGFLPELFLLFRNRGIRFAVKPPRKLKTNIPSFYGSARFILLKIPRPIVSPKNVKELMGPSAGALQTRRLPPSLAEPHGSGFGRGTEELGQTQGRPWGGALLFVLSGFAAASVPSHFIWLRLLFIFAGL